ncbi:hypothetical protein V8B55DRAFT_1565592 [Mucor lusitanicus]
MSRCFTQASTKCDQRKYSASEISATSSKKSTSTRSNNTSTVKGLTSSTYHQALSATFQNIENVKALPVISAELSSHLAKISALKTYEEIDCLVNCLFATQKHLYMLIFCFKLLTNTCRNGFFQRTKILENDILLNVSEPCSVASSARRNRDRTVEELKRKKTGRKSDLIICSRAGIELGCGEAGLEEEFDDVFIKQPNSVDNKQEVVKDLCFKVRILIMDGPKGYACRLRSTTEAALSGKEASLGGRPSEDYWATVEIDYEELDDEDSDQVCLPDSLRSPQRD